MPWLTKTLWVVLPCAAGLLVIVVGFLCDPLWPSQDMTPEMWRDHRLAQERANRMYLAGAAMFAVGAIRFLMRCWSLLARR